MKGLRILCPLLSTCSGTRTRCTETNGGMRFVPTSTTGALAAVCCLFRSSECFQGGANCLGIAQRHRRSPASFRRSLPREGEVVTAAAASPCDPGAAEVALTREAGKNAKLAALLRDAGISSVEVPCIAHQDGPDLPLLPAALVDPGLAYVVVTSPEAAKVFLAGWKEAGEPPVSVACVGKATGDALERGGVTPVFTPSKATAETLAAEVPLVPPGGDRERDGVDNDEGGDDAASPPRRAVLYPASAKAQKTLEAGLAARGFDVRRLNTYDTVPADWDAEAEAAASAAAVAAFGSPSAVKTWAARLGVAEGKDGAGQGAGSGGARGGSGSEAAGGALAACIGETSARACREAGWSESAIFFPEKPGMEGWAKAVGDALAAAKASTKAGSSTVA